MSTYTDIATGNADLPAFPGVRSERCPLDPPAEHADWREDAGLRRVLWRGRPTWAVSRFADIREALSDPRLSADDRTPGFSVQSSSGPGISQAFIRMDDPEHAQLRRMRRC